MRIRGGRAEDAPALAALLAELGYPDDVERVSQRLLALTADSGSTLLVVEDEEGIHALASATLLPLLHEDGSWCRLSALVVAERRRRSGVGRALVAAVEDWARTSGSRYLEVTSGERPDREAAHAFYEALGLREVSRRYLKEL